MIYNKANRAYYYEAKIIIKNIISSLVIMVMLYNNAKIIIIKN